MSTRAATLPRKEVHLKDSICRGDFRKLFLMIEQMPTGFDCALLRESSSDQEVDPNAANAGNDNAGNGNNADDAGNGNQNDDNGNNVEDGDAAAAPAAEEEEGAGDAPVAAAAAAAGDANNQAAAANIALGGGGERQAAAAVQEPAEQEGEEEETEEEAGDFLIKGVKRWPAATKNPSLPSSPSLIGESASALAAAAAAAVTPGTEGGRPRSSSGDVALQVEFRGGLGVGNRCVRADLPLPSTVLRERTGVGARSSLARRLETSPLALFRWLLAKMAAAATASGGGGVGSGASGGVYGAGPADAWSSAQQRFFGNHFQQQQQQEQHQEGDSEELETMPDGWGGGGGGDAGGTGERRERSSSLPAGGVKGSVRQEKPTLPRVLCFPVSLGKGVVDVTPRLVSYFEVRGCWSSRGRKQGCCFKDEFMLLWIRVGVCLFGPRSSRISWIKLFRREKPRPRTAASDVARVKPTRLR